LEVIDLDYENQKIMPVNLEDEIIATGIELIGDIPYDESIAMFDEEGKALFELPDNNAAVNAAQKILTKAGI